MLIISKHKDYYDGVVGTTGIDKTIVYNRKVIEFDKHNIPKPFKNEFGGYINKNLFHSLYHFNLNEKYNKIYEDIFYFIVGFCGKLYIGFKLYKKLSTYQLGGDKYDVKIIYDFNEIKKYITTKRYRESIDDIYYNIINYDASDVFREYNAPIFVYDTNDSDEPLHHKGDTLIINPTLKTYEFYKVFDTFQTFQEIQMYISGVLGTSEKEIIEVEDKYKIIQHGFDKWSFRKEPENEQKRRKKRRK